eukprot:1123399-Pyramimonas_sp.AAC.1
MGFNFRSQEGNASRSIQECNIIFEGKVEWNEERTGDRAGFCDILITVYDECCCDCARYFEGVQTAKVSFIGSADRRPT